MGHGMRHLKHYDVELDMRDGTVVLDHGVTVFPDAKISNGHYVMELEDGSVNMYNMSEVLRISFRAVHVE